MFGLTFPTFKEDWEKLRWFRSLYDNDKANRGIANVSSAYTVPENVFFVRVDATSAPVTITLPSALDRGGRQIGVKKVDASANAVTVARSGSDTIDGATTQSLAAQYSRLIVISNDNLSWDLIVKQ